MNNTVDIYKSLGDPTRIKIIKIIVSKGNNLCVGAIARQLAVSQPAVSQHLKILKNAGLVVSDRIGFHVHYSFQEKTLKAAGIESAAFYKAIGVKKIKSNCEHQDKTEECDGLHS